MAACLIFLGIFLAFGVQANADPITVFDTGVDSTGTPLADGTVGDPHYSLIAVPMGGINVIRVRTSAGGYPIPPYLADDSLSAWIGPNNPQNNYELDGPNGNFVYRTTFTLSSAAAVSFVGQWSFDNPGVDIYLNGVATGNGDNGGQFTTWHPFSFSGAGLAGMNTIDFVVDNLGGPTGLRVEFSQATATPLPAPIWAGLVLLGGTAGSHWYRRPKANEGLEMGA
jgi:hypothetical protein